MEDCKCGIEGGALVKTMSMATCGVGVAPFSWTVWRLTFVLSSRPLVPYMILTP